RYLGATGFAEAMREVGWLETDNGGISIPKFDRHISESAKQRALTAKRAAKCRAGKRNAGDVTSALPREEKRRDKRKRKEKEATAFDPTTVDLPFSSDRFRQSWCDFCQHRQNIKVPLTGLAITRLLNKCKKWGEGTAIASIDATIESGKWTGLYPPKNDSPKSDPYSGSDRRLA
ncbi:MAG: hypothetical protein ACYSWU_26780, partial [Planctomycetota bacterium]